MADFGRLLRSLREAAHVSMGDLARHLKVSVTYISDVERGTRAPLTVERIEKAAELLMPTPEQLLRLHSAAADGRGFFELGVENLSPEAKEVGATLMRGWPTYTETHFQKLKALLKELDNKGKD